MTNATPIPNPLITPAGQSARSRFWILVSLIGFYLFVAFASPILIDDVGLLLLKPHGWWREVDRHWLIGCAILMTGWVALGSGRIAVRSLQGLIAGGWLLLAWMLGLSMSPNWKPELELTALACVTVAATSLVILIVVRRCWSKKLAQIDGTGEMGPSRFQYSLGTLLVVMLLICVTLALAGWIDARYRNYFADPNVQSRWYLGVRRRELEWEVSKVAFDSLLVALACLPVFLSRRKRNVAWAIGLSAIALLVSVLTDELARTYILYPLFQGTPIERYYIDYYLIHHSTNLATVALCLLTAAVAMHWLGYGIPSSDSQADRAL